MTAPYSQRDHSHCYESVIPPCGIKGKHRCCLCKLPPDEEKGESRIKFAAFCTDPNCDRKCRYRGHLCSPLSHKEEEGWEKGVCICRRSLDYRNKCVPCSKESHDCDCIRLDGKPIDSSGSEERFDEFTICKPWELDDDKFFIDATPEQIKAFIHKEIQEAEEKAKEKTLDTYGMWDTGYNQGLEDKTILLQEKIKGLKNRSSVHYSGVCEHCGYNQALEDVLALLKHDHE